jgi:hypothetical protein
VHERIEAIVHSRRVLPSQVLAGFSPDALRVTARAEKE